MSVKVSDLARSAPVTPGLSPALTPVAPEKLSFDCESTGELDLSILADLESLGWGEASELREKLQLQPVAEGEQDGDGQEKDAQVRMASLACF